MAVGGLVTHVSGSCKCDRLAVLVEGFIASEKDDLPGNKTAQSGIEYYHFTMTYVTNIGGKKGTPAKDGILSEKRFSLSRNLINQYYVPPSAEGMCHQRELSNI